MSVSRRLISAASTQVPSGEEIFTSTGTWTAPKNVFKVSVVCIGAGGRGGFGENAGTGNGENNFGGGGGGLGWKNDIPVTPLQTYDVVIGGSSGSYFINPQTVWGERGGLATLVTGSPPDGGSWQGDGGYDGGRGGDYVSPYKGGGGSAADYDADGANGTFGNSTNGNGTSGDGTGASGNNVGSYGYGGIASTPPSRTSDTGSGMVQIRWGYNKDFP